MGTARRGVNPTATAEEQADLLKSLNDESDELSQMLDAAAPAATVEKKSPAQSSLTSSSGAWLFPWDKESSSVPSDFGLPAILDQKSLVGAVKKKKGFETDDEARAYMAESNKIRQAKAEYSDQLKDLQVSDPEAHLKQDPEALGKWYHDTRDRIGAEIANIKAETNFSDENNAAGIQTAISMIKTKEEQLKNLDRMKDNLLTVGLAQYKDPARIGYEYAKIYEPEKLKMIKKRAGIPEAMDEEVLTRIDQNELKNNIPQSLLYQLELKGSTIAMNELSEQVKEQMPEFKAKRLAYDAKIKKLQEAKAANPTDQAIDAQIQQTATDYQNDPVVAAYIGKATDLQNALRSTVLLPAKFPTVAAAMQKKAAIEQKYEESNPFVRQLFQIPNFKNDVESGSYGLIGGTEKGLFGVFGGVAKTLMTVSGQLGIVPEEQAYMRNVDIQNEMDTEFYVPEGARLQKEASVELPATWQTMVRELGLDKGSVEQVYGKPEYTFNPGGILTTMGETTGQVIGQAVLGRAIGGGVQGVGKVFAQGPVQAATGLQKIGAALRNPAIAQDRVGLFASTYATTYGDNYQTAIDNGLNPDDAENYALIGSLGTALTEMISPDTKILRRALGEVPSGASMRKTADILAGEGSRSKRILDFTKAYGKQMFKNIKEETLEEVADVVKTHVLDASYDIDTTKMSFSEDASNTALQTAIGMIPMAVAGGYGATSRMRREALWSAGNNPAAIKGFIQAQVDAETDERRKAELQKKANVVGQVTNTMNQIVANLPQTNQAGRDLSEGEKMDLAEKLFRSRKLKADASQVQDEPLKAPIEAAAGEADQEAAAIVKGTAPAYIINGQSVTKKAATTFLESPDYKKSPGSFQVGIYNDDEVNKLVVQPEEKPTIPQADVVEPVQQMNPDGKQPQNATPGAGSPTVPATGLPGEQSAAPVQPEEPATPGSGASADTPAAAAPAGTSAVPVTRVQDAPLKTDPTPEEEEQSLRVGLNIKSNFDKAPKAVADKPITKTLPDGSKITGRYILYPANAVTASHDPKSFGTSTGFPTLATGANPNDNDYSLPQNRAQVLSVAKNYDDRALQDVPTITPDGVVIDGNNRTMSGQLAAEQGTDTAYNEALAERLGNFGFTPEDLAFVQANGAARLGFVTDSIPAYDTSTFARFNKNAKKEKSPLARAIELGRVTEPRILGQIGDSLEGFENMSDFYKSRQSVKKVFDTLVDGKVILPNELPRYYDRQAGIVTASGREFLESLMLGNAVGEEELGLLSREGVLNYRQKIVRNIKKLTEIQSLGPDYDLKDNLSKAIRLKNELVSRKMTISDYVAQLDIFSNDTPDPQTIITFFNIDGTDKEFKDFLNRYYDRASKGSAGALDLFSAGGPESRNQILDNLSTKFNENQRKITQTARANSSQQPQAQPAGTPAAAATDQQTGQSPATAGSGQTNQANQNPIDNATQISQPVQNQQVPQQSGGSQHLDTPGGEQEQVQTPVEQPGAGDSAQRSGDQGQAETLSPAAQTLVDRLQAIPEAEQSGSTWSAINDYIVRGDYDPLLNYFYDQIKDPRTIERVEDQFGRGVAEAARALYRERNPNNPIPEGLSKVDSMSMDDFASAFPKAWAWAVKERSTFVNQKGITKSQFTALMDQRGIGAVAISNFAAHVWGSTNLANINSVEEFNEYLEVIQEVETARTLINNRQKVRTKEQAQKTIEENQTLNPEEKNAMSAIVRALNDANFELILDIQPGNGSRGTFTLASNVIKLKDPASFSHEIGHFGFYNVLTGNERMEYARNLRDRFAAGNFPNVRAMLVNEMAMEKQGKSMSNTLDDLSEYFAEQFRQYVHSSSTPQFTQTLFNRRIQQAVDRLIEFWNRFISEVRNIANVNPSMRPYFEKLIDASQLPQLTQAQQGLAQQSQIDTAPTQAAATAKAIQLAKDQNAARQNLQDLFSGLNNQQSNELINVEQQSATIPTPEELTRQLMEQMISLGIASYQDMLDQFVQNGASQLLPFTEQIYKDIRDTYTLPAGMVLDDDATIAGQPAQTVEGPAPVTGPVSQQQPPPGSFGALDFGRTKRLTRDIVDYQIRAKQIQDEIVKKGGNLSADNDYYTLFYLAGNKTAALVQEVDSFLGNERRPKKDSFISRLRREASKFVQGKGQFYDAQIAKPGFIDPGKILSQLGMYMYALHAPERNAYNARIRQEAVNQEIEKQLKLLNELTGKGTTAQGVLLNIPAKNAAEVAEVTRRIADLAAGRVPEFPLMADGGSGMTTAQAEATVQAVKDAGVEDFFNHYVTEFRGNVVTPILEQKYKYGLISAETHGILTDYYQHYIPLKAEELKDDGYTTFSKYSDADMYKSKGAVDLLADQRVNPIIQSAVDLKYTLIQGEKNLVYQSLGNLIKENPDPIWNVDTFIHTTRDGKPIDPEASYKEDGKNRFIYIKDKELAKAVTGNAMQSSKAFQLAANVMRYLSTVQTTLSPSFVVNNALSDLFTANLNLTGMEKEKILAKVNGYIWGVRGKKFLGAARAIWGYEANHKAGVSEWQDWARRFATEGGKISYLDMYNTKDEIAKMKKNFGKDFGDQKKAGIPNPIEGVRSAISYLERISTSVENGVRLAVFRSLIEEGMPDYQAADYAKRITTDFNKKGNQSPTLNLWWQFFNAGVQGIRSGVQALRWAGTKGLWLSGSLTALGFTVSMLNNFYSDCEGAESESDCYWRIQDWEKEGYMILPAGDGFFKLRLPRFWGAFYSLGVKTFDAANGHASMAQMGKFMINTLWNTSVPFSGTGGLITDDNEIRGQQLFPTLTQPFIQFANNRDVFDRPIYKSQMPFRPKQPDSQLAFRNTPGFYRGLAEKLNAWTGGSSKEAGLIDVSPNSIEYWFKFGGGGLYTFGEKLGTTAEALAKGELPPVQNVPIVSNLYTRPIQYLNLGMLYKMLENSGKTVYSPEEVQEFNNLLREAVKPMEGGKRYMDVKDMRSMRNTFFKAQRELKRNSTRNSK